MSEERKLILQMVSEGKITAEEADLLLQAIEEGERTAQSAAAQGVRSGPRPTAPRSTGFLENLGETIERAVNQSLQHLDRELRHVEVHLDRKLREHEHLRPKIEEKMRRVAERAAERAAEAEERVARAAERAAERAARQAERMAERMEHRPHAEHWSGTRIFKSGVSIDKETVEQEQTLTMPAEPGDRIRLENRVGDIQVEFYDGSEIVVLAKKTVWGEDKADAGARAEATPISLDRQGQTVEVVVLRPTITAVGVVHIKDTRIDYTLRLPQGTALELTTKVGDIKVTGGQQVSRWSLVTKVGDIEMQMAPEAAFSYDLRSSMGEVVVQLPGQQRRGANGEGRVGEGGGTIMATVKTGNITIHT